MSGSTPPVIRYQLNVLSKWFSSADDGWCDLGLNTYALGWMTRILHSHEARRVLTTDQLSEKYEQLHAMISFELFGGKLSEWFMAVQSLVAEFAALVHTSEKHAFENGDSKSNILNGDNTSIGAALKVLGGRVFKHFSNDIHSTFPTEYEKFTCNSFVLVAPLDLVPICSFGNATFLVSYRDLKNSIRL